MASARSNLIAAQGDGLLPVLRMVSDAPPGFTARTHVLYAGSGSSRAELDRLRSLGTADVDVLPTPDEVIRRLDELLDTATMGTRVYVTGTEGFIGRALLVAVGHGIDPKSVVTEHSGSRARRVQCVHCKHFSEDVTVSIFECPGCGVLLFVRDHYSRRLAAFQGVCANAEDPNERPAPEDAYV